MARTFSLLSVTSHLPCWYWWYQHVTLMLWAENHRIATDINDVSIALRVIYTITIHSVVSTSSTIIVLTNHRTTRLSSPALKGRGLQPCPLLNDQPKIREGLSNYLTLGYVAAATNPESVSITQEYSADDFAIAQFAQALGQTSVVQIYMQRAANWRHIMNNASGYVQPRDASGAWMSGFSPAGQSGFAEGDSAQYTWMAPFDWGALVSDLGGAAKMTARLDSFFTELNSDPTTMYAFMGNEPSFEVPWEYDFTRTPSDTQEVVRRIQLGLFADTPGGLPGNDDGGALSSWYIFSTLGLYPEIAGVGGFVVGSPLFSSAIVSLANGKTLTINAPAAAPGAPYVQALALNGRATSSLWQTWAAIKNGATYTYTLGASTSAWGTAPLDAPPLFLPPGVPKL